VDVAVDRAVVDVGAVGVRAVGVRAVDVRALAALAVRPSQSAAVAAGVLAVAACPLDAAPVVVAWWQRSW
jgi:hypothetical protein